MVLNRGGVLSLLIGSLRLTALTLIEAIVLPQILMSKQLLRKDSYLRVILLSLS